MEDLHYLFMKTQAMFSRRILSGASQLGLTPGQPKVLDFLLQYQEADQKTIAAYCEIEQATVGSILWRMENAGLVVRRQKEGNRRSLYVSLTEKGMAAATQLKDVFQQVEQTATAALTPQEQQTLKEILSKMCGSMQPSQKSEKVIL